MQFITDQKDALSAPLSRDHVKTREQSGRKLSYIEGWVVIKEANRIFGFDSWNRETVDLKCVSEREREIGTRKDPGWGVTYIAKVRISVGTIVREGCGTGHGIDRDLGQAHESALKEAETDAMKRAFMTFGNPFGLALYDKEQAEVEDAPRATPSPPPSPLGCQPSPKKPRITPAEWADKAALEIVRCANKSELMAWRAENAKAMAALDDAHPKLYENVIKVLNAKEVEMK